MTSTSSGTPPFLDDFEDLRRPSSLSPRFRWVPVDGCRRIFAARLLIPRSNPSPKGGSNRHENGLGRSTRGGRPKGFLAHFGPIFRGRASLAIVSLSSRFCGLLTSLSAWIVRMPCRPSLCIFRPSPQSFVPSHCGPWVNWSHVHLEC
jgi:hypothetical protein